MHKIFNELKDILAGIQNGADAKFSELQGIERAFIEQEANAILELFKPIIEKAWMYDELNK